MSLLHHHHHWQPFEGEQDAGFPDPVDREREQIAAEVGELRRRLYRLEDDLADVKAERDRYKALAEKRRWRGLRG